MVNPQPMAAPAACAPAFAPEITPRLSQSEDESSHGKKLYFLMAKEIGHYMTADGSPSPVGQTLVKESWTSIPSNEQARNSRNHASGNRIMPRTKIGDQVVEIGQRTNLFVMTKLAKETPNTDEGWVYGVVQSESKKVLSSGKVASCIACHESKSDRLFGPVASK